MTANIYNLDDVVAAGKGVRWSTLDSARSGLSDSGVSKIC
jgi:hypothetical protein